MQSRVAVLLLAAGVAGLISCRDVAPPQPALSVEHDDWAEAALITLPPFFKYEANGRIMKHFRGRDGTVYSVVAVGDARGGPPKKIFAFENGKIRYVVKPTYKRHGSGWARAHSTVTVFDSAGRRVREAETQPESPAGPALASIAALTPADALPQNFTDVTGCFTEWAAYAAASFALASASVALSAAISACATNPMTCYAVDSAFGIWLAALAAWSVALDKLMACQNGGATPGTKVLKYDGSVEDLDPAILSSIDTFLVVEAL
jgi:hypothetical protein